MLAVGAFAERAHIGPILFFVFAWATLVYDPIAYWTWNPNGWSVKLGGLDYAGGTPVHIASGTAALAISIYLGKRRGYGTEALAYRPHNMTYVVLGTTFLWFGWFGASLLYCPASHRAIRHMGWTSLSKAGDRVDAETRLSFLF